MQFQPSLSQGRDEGPLVLQLASGLSFSLLTGLNNTSCQDGGILNCPSQPMYPGHHNLQAEASLSVTFYVEHCQVTV